MLGMTAHEIYQSLHNGRGPGSMQDAYDAARAESKREEDRAKRINQLAGKIEGGWQGEAGAAAFGAARPIAVVSAVGAANLELTHNLLDQQTHSFGSARTSVKPVSEKPPETGFWDDISPWETDTENQQAQHQADSDHNIRVYGQYDEQSYSNETSLPTDYSTLQDPGDEITVQRPDEPVQPPRNPGEKNDPVTPPSSGDERDPWTPPRPPGDRDDPVKPSGTGDDDGRTTPQRDDPTRPQPPPNTTTRPPLTPPPVGPPPVGPPGLPPMTPPYGPGRGPGSGPGGGGSGRGPGGGGMGRGPGGGAGAFGGRPGGGFGPGGPEAGARAAAGALGEHGQNARSGAGAAGAAGAGAAGQGRGGGAGMGGAGGGRGQGGEDEEHTRASFLQEDDPEAIFGTDQMTAPPVIGE